MRDRDESAINFKYRDAEHATQMYNNMVTLTRRDSKESFIGRSVVCFVDAFKVLKFDSIQRFLSSFPLKQEFDVLIWSRMVETYAKSKYRNISLFSQTMRRKIKNIN